LLVVAVALAITAAVAVLVVVFIIKQVLLFLEPFPSLSELEVRPEPQAATEQLVANQFLEAQQ
jgi:hypothetical protein